MNSTNDLDQLVVITYNARLLFLCLFIIHLRLHFLVRREGIAGVTVEEDAFFVATARSVEVIFALLTVEELS